MNSATATAELIGVPMRLGREAQSAVGSHLLRLSDADRRMRFCRVMTDEAVVAYVDRIDFDQAACFGIYATHQTLVCLAEGFPYAVGTHKHLEAAFTTDEAYRRRGLARMLFEAMGRCAHGDRVERVVLRCARRNVPMRALLAAVGASSHSEDDEVEAEWDVAPGLARLAQEAVLAVSQLDPALAAGPSRAGGAHEARAVAA